MTRNRYFIILFAVWCCLSADAQYFSWAIKPEYDAISEFSEGIAPVLKNGKWGYVSDRGTVILAPAYDAAYPFSEGMGVLASKDRTLVALVDRTGKLTPIREKLQIDSRFAAFSNGLLLVNKGRKWGYLNTDGQQAIECKYDIAQPFSEGLAAAVLDSRQCYCWYYMDVTGKAVFHLSDLKKDIYWALGFRDGKALVLHGKGAFFVDKTGGELKEYLPSITPPENNADYTKPALACKEGMLTFDEKCRAVSFTDKNGKETEFMPAPSKAYFRSDYVVNMNGITSAAEDIRWINPSLAVVKADNSKYGLLTASDSPLLAFSLPSDTLASVFGNPGTTDLNIRNTSPKTLDKVNIRVNEKTFQASSLPAGSTMSYPLSLDKMTENEVESKSLSITAYEEGLQIGERKKTVYIKDVPSLSIHVPTSKITLRRGQDKYSIDVEVKNLSKVQVKNITITIEQQTQVLSYLGEGETGSVRFTFPGLKESGAKTLFISAKAPNTPAVTANARVAIEVSAPTPPAAPPPPPPPPF